MCCVQEGRYELIPAWCYSNVLNYAGHQFVITPFPVESNPKEHYFGKRVIKIDCIWPYCVVLGLVQFVEYMTVES